MDAIDTLNFHHLRYFWTVAKEGGVAAAGRRLRLSHSTLSAQLHALEADLGADLFMKVGRRLVLTDVGQTVFRFADEIFTVGTDLLETVRAGKTAAAMRVEIGVIDVVPKMVVLRLLEHVLSPQLRFVCREGSYERLLGDLAVHRLDVVIADRPVPEGSPVRAFSHLLGASKISMFCTAALARRLGPRFPACLHGAPLLLPVEGLPLRRDLDAWFSRAQVRPRVVGEFQDSALLTVFGAHGTGVFAAPTAVAAAVKAQYGVVVLGEIDVQERFYAVTTERRIKHPAVAQISSAARADLFSAPRARARKR